MKMEELAKYYNSFLYREFFKEEEKDAPMQLNLKQTNNLRIGNDLVTLKYAGKGLHATDVAVYHP